MMVVNSLMISTEKTAAKPPLEKIPPVGYFTRLTIANGVFIFKTCNLNARMVVFWRIQSTYQNPAAPTHLPDRPFRTETSFPGFLHCV